jgi:hypothetical protein
MAINRFSQSSVQNAFPKYNSLWDGVSAVGSMDAIGYVEPAGSFQTTFNSIPGTYQHLQLRIYNRIDATGIGNGRGILRLNGDAGANYSFHGLYGEGAATAASESSSGNTFMNTHGGLFNGNTAGCFDAAIIDILDYSNTNKNTTIRSFYGNDLNGSGFIGFYSGAWYNTAAVTSVTVGARSGLVPSWLAGTTISLYGIK